MPRRNLFYGFEFEANRGTTTGTPNEKTGRLSIAGKLKAFRTRQERTGWICTGDKLRIAVNKNTARDFHMGMHMDDYNMHYDSIGDCLEI